jgi:hypothetical protein
VPARSRDYLGRLSLRRWLHTRSNCAVQGEASVDTYGRPIPLTYYRHRAEETAGALVCGGLHDARHRAGASDPDDEPGR